LVVCDHIVQQKVEIGTEQDRSCKRKTTSAINTKLGTHTVY